MRKPHALLWLQGSLQTRLHVLKPFFLGSILKLKTSFTRKEVEALVPFDNRMWYHNLAIEGKDGFLFHRDHDALEQFTGGIVFRDRQLDVWRDALKAREAWCAANGSHFRMLIVPEKHIVYLKNLPSYFRISPDRPAMQLRGALTGTLASKILYPVEALRAASSHSNTFYKGDTHWTSYGAFVAYRALVESLDPEIVLERAGETDLTFRDQTLVGDIGVRFTPERVETASIADIETTYDLVFTNRNFARGAIHVYENRRRDLPRCVLFRDSFANAMIPFLMRSFSRVVAVSSLSCHYDLLEQEKPDVVLFEIVERFVASFGLGMTIELPRDREGLDFAAYTGTALSELKRPEAP